jgi:hypothetical protein
MGLPPNSISFTSAALDAALNDPASLKKCNDCCDAYAAVFPYDPANPNQNSDFIKYCKQLCNGFFGAPPVPSSG